MRDRNANQSYPHPKSEKSISSTNINDAQIFRFKKQKLVLFCKTFVRCFATTIFIAFVMANMKIYENKGDFSPHQKTNFNAISTALSLCLGLNFFVSHMAHVQKDI